MSTVPTPTQPRPDLGSTRSFLSADFGGSSIKLGVVQAGGVVSVRRLPADLDAKLAHTLDLVAEAWCDMLGEASLPRDIDGVGLALPCVVAPSGDRIVSTFDKYPDSAGFDFDGWGRRHFGAPMVLANDAHAALLGEWRFGAGRGCEHLAMMILGTGIGCAAVVDGILLRGAHGSAGCLAGHTSSNPDGPACKCGNLGCLEAQASGWALPERARRDPRFARSALRNDQPLTVEAIFRRQQAGDELASDLWRQATRTWGAGAVSLIHAYDPQRLIVGGGIRAAGESLLDPLRRYVSAHVWSGSPPVPVVTGELGYQAALLGLSTLVSSRPSPHPVRR